MKKMILKSSLITMAAMSMLISGCSSPQPDPVDPNKGIYIDPKFDGAPQWVLQPEMVGFVTGLGISKKNVTDDIGFQREEATANGRVNIAKTLNVKASNILLSHKSSTAETFDQASSSTTEVFTSESLQNTRVKNTWINRNGTMFVLMYISSEEIISQLDKAAKTSYKDDKAGYQKYEAAKANGDLQKRIEQKEAQ